MFNDSVKEKIESKTIQKPFAALSFCYSAVIFLLAAMTRLFHWQDSFLEVPKVQWGVVATYQLFAKYLVEDGFLSFFDAQSRISTNIDFLGHPPGYSYLIALIFSFAGESNAAIQFVSIFFDSFSAVMIFLIAKKLFSHKIALIAGFLSAFSPQFALNSNFLLPDTLSIFPILVAIFIFIHFVEKPNYFHIALTGILIGLSCWLRANTLLMPIFFVFAIIFLVKEKRIIYSIILLTTFFLTISPITIRNAIVYKQFIPLSLGAGQTLLEGIGDYDPEQKFGFPKWDVALAKKESEVLNRPDYGLTLFGPDGIKRDRMRINQGWQVIKENPFWFSTVMIRRALSMLRLERMVLVSTEIPVTNSLKTDDSKIKWKISMDELAQNGNKISPEANISLADNILTITTDKSKRNDQFSTPKFRLERNKDYLARARFLIKQGRFALKIKGVESQNIYASIDVIFEESHTNEYFFKNIEIAFVPTRDEEIQIILANDVSEHPNSQGDLESIEVYELGDSSFTWTPPIRFIVRIIQKMFISAIIIPLAIFGLIILLYQRQKTNLIILLIIPLYFMSVQSALHTEYRYTMAILHFFFVLVAVFVVKSIDFLNQRFRRS